MAKLEKRLEINSIAFYRYKSWVKYCKRHNQSQTKTESSFFHASAVVSSGGLAWRVSATRCQESWVILPPHSAHLPHTQQPKKEKEYSEGEPETTRTITKKKKKNHTFHRSRSLKQGEMVEDHGREGGSFIARANWPHMVIYTQHIQSKSVPVGAEVQLQLNSVQWS